MNFSEIDKNLQYLALELKTLCDSRGIEISSKKSAKIIHKIGLEYLKLSPDKVSLIRSVGLLNSALARQPNNASKIESDLAKVCQHIVKQANASRQTVDLVQHAKYVKSQIKLMRTKTNQALTEIKFAKTENQKKKLKFEQEITTVIKNIQQQITSDYKQIVIELCQYCVDIMGPPPCKFAVVGMGSFARKEITPYSDFEHIILMEILAKYKIHLDYFRWFSVIFHTIILNLQESTIPSLNIKYLNDKTCDLGDWFFDTYTSGVSFDGMMPHACKFPLGRTQPTKKKPWTTELIKPVDKMLEYLSSKENLKNGYHLSDILTETCFVYGEQTLHDQFLTGIQWYKNFKTTNETLDELRKRVKEDLDKFGTRLNLGNLKPTKPLNVKQLFYRTSTLFIVALGKMCSIDSSSCFDIINELAEQKKITKNTKHKLSLAVAIGCKIRLGIYMKKKSQCDYLQPRNDAETIFDDILDVIDTDSIVSYFQITYCLQVEVIKMLGINKKSHIYCDVKMLNIAICYVLKLNQMMLALSEDMFGSYTFLSYNSKVLIKFSDFFKDDSDFFVKNLDSSNNSSLDSQKYDNFDSTDKHSKIEMKFSLFDKSIQDLEKRLSNVSKLLSIPDGDWLNPEHELLNLNKHVLNSINILQLGAYEEAFEFWERYLEIFPRWFQANKDQNFEKNVEFVLNGLIPTFAANCLVELNRLDEALVHLNHLHTQPFFQQRGVNKFCQIEGTIENPDINVNPVLVIWRHLIAGGVWFKLKNFEKSLFHLQISFGLVLSLEQHDDFEILELEFGIALYSHVYFNGIGSCLMEMKQYENALLYFEQTAKSILDDDYNDDYDEHDDKFKIYMLPKVFQGLDALLNFSNCLLKLRNFDIVIVWLKCFLETLANWGLENWQIEDFSTALKKKRVETLAKTLYQFGQWYKKQNYFKEAVTYFQNSLSIDQKLNKTKKVFSTRAELLRCHMQMYQRDRSEKFLKDLYQSKKFDCSVATNTALNFNEDDALSYHFEVGHGFLKMKYFKKALEFLKISLGVAMSKDILESKMCSIMLYNSIGICFINLRKYEESLIYFKLAKEMLEKYTIDKKLEENLFQNLQIANSFYSVGKCFLKLDRFEEAVSYLGVSLEIFPFDFDDNDKVIVFLSTISVSHLKVFQEHQSLLFDIGYCHMQQNHYENAQYFFQESLFIYNKLPKADEASAVTTRRRLLTCHMELYQRERVEKHLKDLRGCNSIETTIRMVDTQTLTYSIEL